jgi:hypothetical protein
MDNPNEAEQISINQRYFERAIYLKLSISPILFFDNSSGGLKYKLGLVITLFVMYLTSKHENIAERATKLVDT